VHGQAVEFARGGARTGAEHGSENTPGAPLADPRKYRLPAGFVTVVTVLKPSKNKAFSMICTTCPLERAIYLVRRDKTSGIGYKFCIDKQRSFARGQS